MLKLLLLFPIMLVGGAVALGIALPLLAFLPIVLALGAVVLVFSLFGLFLRLLAGLVMGAGVLFAGAIGFGFLFAGGAVVLALGFALAHLFLPLLLIVGLVWLIRRGSRPAAALPAPHV